MKPSLDLSFCLVASQGNLSFQDFFNVIKQSIEGGVTFVQLREKSMSTSDMVNLGKKLILFLKPYSVPLIINDRVDVAHMIGADGVHLGQSDLNVKEARALLGKSAMIGLSVETEEQALLAEDDDVDYLAASPVFTTTTKLDCQFPWGLDGLKKLCSISRHPILAIGGIDETNVKEVMQCGAVGIAVVSAIFNAPCPKTAALGLSKTLSRRSD